MTMKKICALLLAAITSIAVLVSCKTGGEKPAGTTEKPGTGTPSGSSTTVNNGPDIPADAKYDGYDFTILTWAPAGAEWQYSTFNIDSDNTSDRVSESCYRRNSAVTERLGVKVSEDTTGSAVSLDRLNQIVMSEPDEFDIVLLKDRFAFSASCEGLVAPYTDLEYVDLERNWWYPEMTKALTINNKIYFAYGIHNLDTFNMMQIMLFNAQYIKDNRFADPYDLVRKGEWTIDRMYEMAMAFTKDVNNDNEMKAEDDLFGVIASQDTWYTNFGAVSGHDTIEKDDKDAPVITVLNDETLISIWQKVLGYEKTKKSVLISGWDDIGSYAKSSNRYENAANMFAAGKSLFLGTFVGQLDTVSAANMKQDYGIIPFPTYSEKKEGETYIGYMYGSGNAFTVPNNASNLTRTSIILEVIAYESYEKVLPELYEVKTLIRNNPDDNAKEMLVMMNNNRRIDLSVAFWFDIGTAYLPSFKKGSDTFVSDYTANITKYQSIIDESLAKLDFHQ